MEKNPVNSGVTRINVEYTTISYVPYKILASHYLACYLDVGIFNPEFR